MHSPNSTHFRAFPGNPFLIRFPSSTYSSIMKERQEEREVQEEKTGLDWNKTHNFIHLSM